MDKRLLAIPAALLLGAAAFQVWMQNKPPEPPDSELTVYATRADCESDGQAASTCTALWNAATARAEQTASLYTTLAMCEQRYGTGRCRAGYGEVSARTGASRYYAPILNGVALASDVVPTGLQIIAYEPVYPCPFDWVDRPVCFQTVRGVIYTEYGKHRPGVYAEFDRAFRNADRERIGDPSDDWIGYRLITPASQLVEDRSQAALDRSRAAPVGTPRSPERRRPETTRSVFQTDP
jgi:hypothetical protein